ncbi:MAG: hypothetical protein FWE49_03805 [Synergistaceae bacterium]|nr:hypothetical protein [Synergistaceae bacterium]
MADIRGVPSQNIGQQSGQLNRLDGSQTLRVLGHEFRNGSLVTGEVLNVNKNGGYLVQIQDATGLSQKLMARATLPLILGQSFRAIWDNTGDTPILRLSENDFALLSKFGEGIEREIANALLVRGMPLTSEMISWVRMAWRMAGDKTDNLSSILEMWARDLPMTPANIQIISWYLALARKDISKKWNKVRLSFRERVNKGESPVTALKNLSEGEDDVGMFLKGHSLLSKPLKHDVDTSAMAAVAWAVGDDEQPLLAKIRISSGGSNNETDRAWWQVGFEIEGEALGAVTGEVESDSISYVVGLRAEEENTFQTLRFRRDALRRELEDVPMSLQHIGVNQGKRTPRTANRSLDIKV